MALEFTTVVGIISGIIMIAGIGWKLNHTINSLKDQFMKSNQELKDALKEQLADVAKGLEVHIVKTESEMRQLHRLEERVNTLEQKLLMKSTTEL